MLLTYAVLRPVSPFCSAAITDPVGGPEIIERHFVPSMHMVLNWLQGYGNRLTLPQQCQVHLSNSTSKASASMRFSRVSLGALTTTDARIVPHYSLPALCSDWDALPNFPQTFFDDSAMSTTMARWFGLPRIPIYIPMPETCTYQTYAAGLGCKFNFDEPISASRVQVRASHQRRYLSACVQKSYIINIMYCRCYCFR